MANKDTWLQVRIDQELKEKLEAAAAFEQVSMSEMVRRFIERVPVIGKIEDGRIVKKEVEHA